MVGIIIGGLAEIVPLVAIESNVPTIASVHPYTPLELEGRDIYVREGCYTCHSQMVRPFKEELIRYGDYSKAGEFIYDRPFQFGSKRTGPDLHRLGGKYPDFWHYRHMLDPRSTSPGSIMPTYGWLYSNDLDTSLTQAKLKAFRRLGAPYTDEQINNAVTDLETQSQAIANNLRSQGVKDEFSIEKKEIVAMIAYLQRLGTDIKKEKQ
jgi:cytochrome c oxidase cbb3-type subunit I/II